MEMVNALDITSVMQLRRELDCDTDIHIPTCEDLHSIG